MEGNVCELCSSLIVVSGVSVSFSFVDGSKAEEVVTLSSGLSIG